METTMTWDETRPRRSGHVIAGVVLIGLGLLFVLDRAGMLEAGSLGQYWPFILIVLGLGKLSEAGGAAADRQAQLRSAAWLLFLGGLFLLHEFTLLTLRRTWPLFLVAAGLGMIWNAMARPAGTGTRDEDARDGH
jgi:hypothetical protein